MVLTNKPKQQKTYLKEELDAAVRKVQDDRVSIANSSKRYNVHEETLRRWANNAPNPLRVGSGRYTSASTDSEEEIIAIVTMIFIW